jgi:hypothetical protein
VNTSQQEALIEYLNNGGAIYFEGVNIGTDHNGTDFLSYFGLNYEGQGLIHTGISSLEGQEDTFSEGKLLEHQVNTYADIYNNWFSTTTGQVLFRSNDNHIRTIVNETTNYRTIASSFLVAAVIDSEGLNTKRNLMQLYMSYLTNTPGPELYANQTSLDFGVVVPGESAFQTILLQNLGNNPLSISNITSSNPIFEIVNTSPVTLELGNMTEIKIQFNSEISGAFEGEISFNTNDPDNLEVIIPVEINNYTFPAIEYPAALEANSYNGDGEISFELNNLGQQGLTYWIEVPETERNSGGTDLYGYSWKDSDEEGVDFVWNDISEVGTYVNFLSTDDSVDLELPFSFPFYGELKDIAKVSTDGYITFGEDGVDYSNDPIPSPFQPNDLIAIFWDDLNGSNADFYYYYDEENSDFIVQYSNFPFFNGTGNLNFQAHLYENGNITFYYDLMEGNLYSSTIGIENSDATDGLQVIYNGNYLTSYHAIEISYNAPWVELDKWQGEIAENSPETITVNFPQVFLPSNLYSATIKVHTNDPNNSLVEIPLTVDITTVDNDDNAVQAIQSDLQQNYPNPFNPETTISFFVDKNSEVVIDIYDIKGRKVKSLVRENYSRGNHSVVWNGRNEEGNPVASGVYLYKMRSGSFSKSRKMILLK